MCNCSMQEGASLHFSSVHNININVQTLEFPSLSEFIGWKENMKKETISKFVKRRGSKNAESHTTHYYICHRSSNFVSKSKGQRCLKTQRSNKIGGVCPASMTVREDHISGKCDVTFVKSHVSHENTIGHVFLTHEERKQLAVKIASKVPFDVILDDVRDSVSNNELTCLHLLTKKDLHNIDTSYNLSSIGVRHQNDAISVEACVNKMKKKIASCFTSHKV